MNNRFTLLTGKLCVFFKLKAMEPITLNKKIDAYVASRLSEIEKVDFEAEMMMDKELEKEVARQILKKMQIERTVREHIETVELERIGSIQVPKNTNIFTIFKKNWLKLTGSLSSY